MKKVGLFTVILMFNCISVTAQDHVVPDMYASIFPGNPVKIDLPPKGQFILATPVTANIAGMVGSASGKPAGLFLTEKDQQEEIFKKIQEAADAGKIVILFGVEINPLHYWSNKMYRKVREKLTKKGFSELQNYRWLSLSSYMVLSQSQYKEWVSNNKGSVTIER